MSDKHYGLNDDMKYYCSDWVNGQWAWIEETKEEYDNREMRLATGSKMYSKPVKKGGANHGQ